MYIIEWISDRIEQIIVWLLAVLVLVAIACIVEATFREDFQGNSVEVVGAKDSMQVVEWKGKLYKLVKLSSGE